MLTPGHEPVLLSPASSPIPRDTSPVFILVDEPENAFRVNGPAQGPVLTCNGHPHLSHSGPCGDHIFAEQLEGKIGAS